jgi:hypothetical protein
MIQYPEVYNWKFFYGDLGYKLLCKQKMYWETYKFKASDIKLLDKEAPKELRQEIADSLNEEIK